MYRLSQRLALYTALENSLIKRPQVFGQILQDYAKRTNLCIMERSVIALLYGPDQPGIVAKVAGWIHEHGGNVLHADQHLDRRENIFSTNQWCPAESRDLRSESDAFSLLLIRHRDEVRVALGEDRPKIAIIVSKADHCFDLVLRVRSGEWNANIAGVLSNHESMRSVSEGYGLDYLYLRVSKETKQEAEQQQRVVEESGCGVILALRQVLSSSF